jgi:hypothetical protein
METALADFTSSQNDIHHRRRVHLCGSALSIRAESNSSVTAVGRGAFATLIRTVTPLLQILKIWKASMTVLILNF